MKIQTQIKSKKDFREWLAKNHNTAKECWIQVKRTKPIDKDTFYYRCYRRSFMFWMNR